MTKMIWAGATDSPSDAHNPCEGTIMADARTFPDRRPPGVLHALRRQTEPARNPEEDP